jgi:four helix bundle protein
VESEKFMSDSNLNKGMLKDKAYEFALRIVKMYQLLKNDKKEFVLSKQLVRSGTAVAALIEEANNAESRADFIHKLSIANKEANETRYWLRLLIDSEVVDKGNFEPLIEDCTELIRMLVASIKTAKSNRK